MFTYSKAVAREFQCDVLVIGGGPAGFGAAVAAARNGADTILIERNAMLGGMATTGLVGPAMTMTAPSRSSRVSSMSCACGQKQRAARSTPPRWTA